MQVKNLRRMGMVGAGGAAFIGGLAFAGLGAGNAMADTQPPANDPVRVIQNAYNNAPQNVKQAVNDGVSAAQGRGIDVPLNTGGNPTAPATAAVAPRALSSGRQNAVATTSTAVADTTNGTENGTQNNSGGNLPENANPGPGGLGGTPETGNAEDVPLSQIAPDIDKLATSRSFPELVNKYIPGGGDWLEDSGTMDQINNALDGAIDNGNNTEVNALPENGVADQYHEQIKQRVLPYVCNKDVCGEAVADLVVNSANGAIDDLIQLGSDPRGWITRHAQLTVKGVGGAAAGIKDFTDDPALWTADRFNELYHPDAAIYDVLRGIGGEELAYAAYAFAERNLPYATAKDGREFNWPKLVLWAAALSPAAVGLALGAVIGLIAAIPVAIVVGVAVGVVAGIATLVIAGALQGTGLPIPVTWAALLPWAIGIGIAAGIAAGVVTFLVVGAIVATPFIIASAIFSAILGAVTYRVPWFINGTALVWHPPKGECPEEGAPTLINKGAVSPLTPKQRIAPKVNTWIQVLGDIPGFFGGALTDPNAPASPLRA